MNRLKEKLLVTAALYMPFLIRFKRYLIATTDSARSIKKTYSQSGEDLLVRNLLPVTPLQDVIYIEVGANQPTQISNTYLFYRMGFNGIVIEPNKELSKLFTRIRPKDIHLEAGCSVNSGVGMFKKTHSSGESGFSDNINAVKGGTYFVPMLTVDEIWKDTGSKDVFLLSIDTEGFDLQVLKGAAETLKHTACIIIETREDDLQDINAVLINSGFRNAYTTENNFIWINEATAGRMTESK